MEINVCIYRGVSPSAFVSKVNLALLALPYHDSSGCSPTCRSSDQSNNDSDDDNGEDYSKSNSI